MNSAQDSPAQAAPQTPLDLSRIPSVAAIQRTNALLAVITAGILGCFVSIPSAIGCLIGGAVVIGNLFLLAALGRFALAAAGQGGAGAKLGLAALPLKLLMLAGLVYLVFTQVHIDGLGFGFGVLTQMVAIIIETGRASRRSAA
jgi:hypothetical protein